MKSNFSELPTDITEEDFKQVFSTRFGSMKTAKIFREKDGKVYGFVRFTGLCGNFVKLSFYLQIWLDFT